ncbi:MAG: TonB-dependent receptor plug domain-containing protein [Caldimicrobium sp.]
MVNSKKIKNLILFSLIFNLALAAELQAQQENTESYEEYALGEIVVIGEKTPAVREVTKTTVVTAEELKDKNVRTVAEALIYVAGLRVSTGRKNEPNVSIHGLEQTRILVLIDGVPYYETKFGRLDLNAIPIDNIAKIEIEKGVSSILYGPNSLGGVINIITKKPTEKQHLEILLERRDYETYRTSVSLGKKINKISYWINYSYYDSKGWYLSNNFRPELGTVKYQKGRKSEIKNKILEDGDVRDNSAVRSNNLWLKLGFEPSKDSEYYLNFHYLTMYKESPLPIGKYLTSSVFLDRPAFSQFARMPRYDNWGIDFSGKQKISENITLKGKVFYHFHLDDYKSYYDETFKDLLSISRYKDWMYGFIFTPEIKLGESDILRFGFQYRKDVHRERDDIYLPFEDYSSSIGSLGVENEFTFLNNKISLVAGLQYDWFKVNTAKDLNLDKRTGNFISYKNLEKPGLEDSLNPMLGLSYFLSENTKLYASLARKVRFPTLSELYTSRGGNPNLKPEKSWNYVAGISHTFNKAFRGEISFFYHDIKDWITRDIPTFEGRFENKGKISIAGFELSSQYTPFKNFFLEVNYTYSYAKDKSPGRITDKVKNIPKHKVDITMNYVVPRLGIKATLVGLYMGKVWGQLPTSSAPYLPAVEVGDYFIVNVKLSKEFKKHLELYLGAENLFDRNYQQELDFPGPGRNLYAGMIYKF